MAVKKQLAVAVFAGVLSMGFIAGAEGKAAAAPAPASPAPTPAAPAPAPAPGAPAPGPGAPAPGPAAPKPGPSAPKPGPAAPSPGPAAPAPGGGSNPANPAIPARNDPGRIQPATPQNGQNPNQGNAQPTNPNDPDGRHHVGRWDHRFAGSRALSGWAPYSWWYSGNSYWWPPYDPGYDAARTDDTYTTPGTSAAPANPTLPQPTFPTPAQDQAKATNQLEGLPAYRQAMAELTKAQTAYDSASAKVLEKLKTNPQYQELIKIRDRAEEKVEAVQAGGRIPSPEQVTPAAQQKLDIKAKITRMEQDAILADPAAASAQSRLVDANARVQTYKKQAQTVGGQ